MMAKFIHQDVMDRGLTEIVNNANQMSLITGYAVGDAYAVAIAKSVCNVAMGPADMVTGPFGTNERKIDVAAKTGTASSSSPVTPDLHIALVDTAGSRILAVADETSDQPVTNGNPINFPSWEIRARQPV
jgi:hypothetical protein